MTVFLLGVLPANPAHADTPPAAAIASPHPMATEAGIEILEQGGNAFDAAVAVSAAMAVVVPFRCGVGGGGFWLLHRESDGRQVMVDGRETAPAAAFERMYLDENDKVIPKASLEGPLAAGIPGFVSALGWLAELYGRLPLKESLAPAVRLARNGFPVSPHYQRMAGWRRDLLLQDPESARIFLDDGQVPEAGYSLKQKDLGELFENIGKYGPSYFYTGEFAQRMVTDVRAAGGIWSMQDLADYRVRERTPTQIGYRGIRVISAPPPSSGGIVLGQALTMLEEFDLEKLGHITRMHVTIEAMRRAYRDRAVFLGDPDFVQIPTQRLLDRTYLAGLAVTIDPKRATPSSELGDTPGFDPVGDETGHFSVIDAEGNRVAGTLSINLPFGAGFVPKGTGVLLNDEMDDFSIKEATPNTYGLIGYDANAVEPGKRPLSSMTPTFLETDDRVAILGTPGGSRIISMVLLAILDFARGNLPNSWVTLNRYHHQYLPDEVQYELHGLTEHEKAELRALGHHLTGRGYRYGDMHAILWDRATNQVHAASDPRGEGKAMVLEME